MPTQRSPLSTTKPTLVHGQSLSESDIASASTHTEDKTNITVRSKRQRIDYSPNKRLDFDPWEKINDFKSELLDMLTLWKTEQDQRFQSWKADQDNILAKLVNDVAELKKQCHSIQNTNSEIERSMAFIDEQYENLTTKICTLEREKLENSHTISDLQKQLQDMHFQSRQASIEIRNIPNKGKENTAELISIVSDVGKIVNMDIQATALRDIYRIPGKPGINRPIIADFCYVNTRNEFLSKVRNFNKERLPNEKLNTQILGIDGDKKPVFVEEHLPPAVKKLFYDTRQFAKAQSYSCWYSNGRILLRKDPAEKPIQIKSEKCLKQLLIQQ